MEATNLGLKDLFGEKNGQQISDIFNHTIWWLESKASGLFQPPCLKQWKDNFPIFAGVIVRKLGEAYTLMVFELLVFWTARIVKPAAPDQALQKISH